MASIGYAYALEYRRRVPVSTWELYDVFADRDIAEEHQSECERDDKIHEFRVREYHAAECCE